ncbi:MAG: URC4/urg3 family protein [Rubrivivax sp.]
MPFRDPLAALRESATIRARCAAVTRAVEQGRSGHFKLDRSALPAVAQRVAALTRERFPDLKIPYHSRWRHFEAGGVDRKGELDALLAGRTPAEVARARIDLTVVSVLLDAGAGPQWRYTERPELDALALPVHRQKGEDLLAMLGAATGGGKTKAAGEDAPEAGADTATPAGTAAQGAAAGRPGQPGLSECASFGRSEGLGVASFRAFVAGVFSSDPADPLRVDALALKRLDAAALRAVFQASPSNPLVGLEGRAALLARLGEVLQAQAQAEGGEARPSRLYDQLTEHGQRTELTAGEILRTLVTGYAPIWTSGNRVLGLPAGDVWPHLWAGAQTTADGLQPDRATGGWVPFHKLSQWLTYSLLEPFEWAGVRVTGLDALTGLPEYRNGGLLLDAGVIVPRDARDLAKTWKPASEFVIEWRALTVTLLDELAVLVRQALGVSAEQMPLACILEGGTWAAGRQIARERREGGAPPVQIDSDGTVF